MGNQDEPEEVQRLRKFKAVITAVLLAVAIAAVFVALEQRDHPEALWPRVFWFLLICFSAGLGLAAPLLRKWLRKD